MQRSPVSVRPSTPDNTSVYGGLGGRVGDGCDGACESRVACAGGYDAAAVFPVGETDAQGNSDELEAAEEEEVTCPPCLPSPYQPTRSEFLDHCVTHFPFRAWCRHCLESRGKEFGHDRRHGLKDANAAAVVSFDYVFLSDGDEVTTEEEFQAAGEGAVKILVIRDSRSKALFAHVVPVKGIDEKGFAVNALVEDIKWLGYSSVTLKSDNEPAIVKLLTEALRELRINGLSQILEEHSPEYDPQANGSAEVGVKLVKGHFRCLRSSLEEHLGHRIPVRHPLMTWLVRHAANVITWCSKGHDGQTAYQRVRQRQFTTRLMGFGEVCSFKLRAQEPIANSIGGRRFHRGIFVGIDKRTGQYMLHSPEGVKLARTVVRVPDAEKYSKEDLSAVCSTPWDLFQAKPAEVVFQKKDCEQQPVIDKAYVARRAYLQAADFEEFGLTRGCPKCDYKLKYGTWGSRPHSDRCRARVESELAKTPLGMARLQTTSARLDMSVGELGQQYRADLPQGEKERNNAEVVQDQHDVKPPPVEFIPLETPSRDTFVERLVAHNPNADVVADAQVRNEEDMTPQVDQAVGNDMGVPHDGGMDIDMVELQALMAVLRREEKEAVEEANRDILAVFKSLGGSGQKYKRERKKALKAVVSEVYSPPRVTAAASKLLPELRVFPGFALDLTTADTDGKLWDFDRPEMRERALKKLREEKPLLLVGSPMCTAFSTWQRINNKIRDGATVEIEKKRAVMHLEFCIELYREQLRHGRYFLHEHPAYASSWQEDAMKELVAEPGVLTSTIDQCLYGSETDIGEPIKKPTKFVTNSAEMAKQLCERCLGRHGSCSRPGGGTHQQCRGRIARAAAVYSFKLCRAILVGFKNQLRQDGRYQDGFVGLMESFDREQEDFEAYRIADTSGAIFHVHVANEPVFRDDLTGQLLPPELVHAARKKELGYFEAKKVWEKRAMGEARRVTGRPPITVRWVDVNKGDNEHPNIRSRLVARQIRQAGEDAIFAPTPPLEALRSVLSLAMTDFPGRPKHVRDGASERRTQISAIDISRAYFNAVTDPESPTFVALPQEHPDHQTKCGLLKRHMYGTRAAADGWQQEYSSFLKSIGFKQGEACPCLFRHEQRGLVTSVHGDDFTSAGPKCELDIFENQLEAKYELKRGGRLGPGPDDCKELTVLNRVIRWTDKGVEYEADPRQAEKLLEGLSLSGDDCKARATPGQKPIVEQLKNDRALSAEDHTVFRALAARANYLAQDRIDLQFSAKEICRYMSSPTEASRDALKWLGRFLLGHKRVVFSYPFQRAEGVDVYSDTDWSGCPRTRKSTSGGCIMIGQHCIRTWSSTQPSVTLSSGEAEYYGLVKAAGAGLGHQSLMQDLGLVVPVTAWTDSSVAIGIASRSGLGKLRHLETHTLWLQEKVRTGAITVKKVRGEVNPADLFTKHLASREKVHQLLGLFGCQYREGRPVAAPLLRPMDDIDQEGGHLVSSLPSFKLEEFEAELHDITRLPHMHSKGEIERMFPTISAAPLCENSLDWEPNAEVNATRSERPMSRRAQRTTTAEVVVK